MLKPPNQPSHLTRGYTAALISAVFLSTTAIFIRYLTQTFQLPALVLACWRDFFVSISLLPILLVFRPKLIRVNRKQLAYLAAYGFLLAVFNSLWTVSVTINGAAVSTVLAYCSAGFTALLGWLLLKERLDWGKILAVILSLAGCVLVSGALDPAAWTANILGIVTGTFSGLAYAIYTLMGRKASQDGLNPWTTILYTFFFAAIFLLAANLTMGGRLPGVAAKPADLLWLGDQTAGWVILFVLAIGPTLAGFGLYNVSLVDLPSSVANLVVTLEPAFTAIIAYFFLNERLNATQIMGSILILGGVVFLRIYEGRVSNRILSSP